MNDPNDPQDLTHTSQPQLPTPRDPEADALRSLDPPASPWATAWHATGMPDSTSRPRRRNPPNEFLHPSGRLGRLPRKGDVRALLLHRFAALDGKPPTATNFWRRRAPFALRSYGNRDYGCCAFASQALLSMRLERLEQRTRPASISDSEIVRVYLAATERLYGGGDVGMYETDALDTWRRPELTFKDDHGRALTIDAYLRINVSDQDELRRALWLAAGHGIKFCINLPWAFSSAIGSGLVWDVPRDGTGRALPLTGDWMPGSWGGHSMMAYDYDARGLWFPQSWDAPDQLITWEAVAAYVDEAHVVIDSIDYWRTTRAAKRIDLKKLRLAVNRISSQKIA